ncbi:MAG: carbohydrate kinase family protein [Anaerolineae bacterium]|nr:carbohydrate kinase family protein [Anaerolineae bacterium]
MAFDYDFLGVGGLAVDLTLQVDQLPTADGKYPAGPVARLPGGFIGNATCAAAHLGLRTGYAGWVGDDADGTLLHADFVRWGVDPAGLVRVPGEPTPVTIVITSADGERLILLPSCALYHAPLTPDQIALARRAQIVYTFPRDVPWCEALLNAAHDGGGQLALDVETSAPLQGDDLRRMVQAADVAFLTRRSLAAVGAASIRDLAAAPGQWIILTAGSRGAYGFEAGRKKPVFQPALPVRVVDTTGAGDCFHAALLAARLDGASLSDALAFAAATAAIKIQHHGARGGLPTRAEVHTLLDAERRKDRS